jgi:hypothetical protein
MTQRPLDTLLPVGEGPPSVSGAIVKRRHFLQDTHGKCVRIRVLGLTIVLAHALKSLIDFEIRFSQACLEICKRC